MKTSAKRILSAVLSMIMILSSILLTSSCSGFIIKPEPDGSITVTPTPDNGEGNNDDYGKPVTYQKGVGDAVNLLTGGYTDFPIGTERIWNDKVFNGFSKTESLVRAQDTTIDYEESLDAYINHLTAGINKKTSVNASVGVGKVFNATAGYSFEIDAKYNRKAQSETKTAFYDMNYRFVDRIVGIEGANDKDKMSSALSDKFLADALKVQNGEMTPDAFVALYGTHIVTAGIYGAKFNLHYEMIADSSAFSTSFELGLKEEITAQVQGKIKVVDIGGGVQDSSSINLTLANDSSSKDLRTKFVAKSVGGNAPGVANSLDAFVPICEKWADGLESSNNYVLIDVPDGSLFFVWDYLGDEYAEAKEILDSYFYAICDEQYYALKSKVSSIYSDSVTYDDIDGTLTINVAGLQSYEKADISSFNYSVNGVNMVDENGVLTIYSKYNGKPVNRVVLIGGYKTEDLNGRIISTKFNNFSIKFDEFWTNDIVLELVNFACVSADGYGALDFSEVASKNVNIIVTNAAYLSGNESLAIYWGNVNNRNITNEDKLELFDVVKTEASILLESREIRVGGDGYYECYDLGMNREDLKALGYTNLSISIDLWGDMIEFDLFRTSWYVEIYDYKNTAIFNEAYDHWDYDWTERTVNISISIDAIRDDGGLQIKYGRHDGDYRDDWNLGTTEITVKVTK